MISKDDIKTKDFSVAMSSLCSKLSAIHSALLKAEDGGYVYSDEDIVGFSLLVRDIHDDLQTISCTLYGN